MKPIKAIITIFQAILPVIGFGLLSILIYSELTWPYNIITAVVICILGIYASIFVFRMMSRRGIITVMTGDNASYELDNLQPVSGDGVSKLTPEELQTAFLEGKIELGHCKISIWGDSKGRLLNSPHKIKTIEYHTAKQVLTILFVDSGLLRIKSPKIIFSASTYLKILTAKEVLWQTPEGSLTNQYSYLNTGNKIRTKSNTDWKPHSLDLGIGMNAIYLQG